MSRRNLIVAAAAAILLAPLLGGCGFDYLQHTDRISYRAGDAVKANLERETMDPARGSMFDVTGLGKNGSVLPKPSTPPAATP